MATTKKATPQGILGSFEQVQPKTAAKPAPKSASLFAEGFPARDVYTSDKGKTKGNKYARIMLSPRKSITGSMARRLVAMGCSGAPLDELIKTQDEFDKTNN